MKMKHHIYSTDASVNEYFHTLCGPPLGFDKHVRTTSYVNVHYIPSTFSMTCRTCPWWSREQWGHHDWTITTCKTIVLIMSCMHLIMKLTHLFVLIHNLPKSKTLRIHDTLVPKTTANMTFKLFLCCHLITTQDRTHKVYISLKLRAFYNYFKKEKHRNVIVFFPLAGKACRMLSASRKCILYGVYLV